MHQTTNVPTQNYKYVYIGLIGLFHFHLHDPKRNMFWSTDYGRPMKPFFILIPNFWAWADILGWNFLRHMGNFRLDYGAPILVLWVSCPCFSVFNHYFYKKLTFISNSQTFIWEWSVVRATPHCCIFTNYCLVLYHITLQYLISKCDNIKFSESKFLSRLLFLQTPDFQITFWISWLSIKPNQTKLSKNARMCSSLPKPCTLHRRVQANLGGAGFTWAGLAGSSH